MLVIVIKERDDTLNVIGPFWHENAATEFGRERLPEGTDYVVCSATDRDKFGHALG